MHRMFIIQVRELVESALILESSPIWGLLRLQDAKNKGAQRRILQSGWLMVLFVVLRVHHKAKLGWGGGKDTLG